VLAASIIRATSHRNNPENSHLHTRRYENLKSHLEMFIAHEEVMKNMRTTS
jgi:hypothetical protein